MPEPLFSGIGVALLTLFNEDLSLDAVASAAHAARLVDAGVRGVIVAGSTGEAAALDGPERAELVRATKAAIGESAPVLAGVGAPSRRQALGYADYCLDAGADALLALSLPGAADQRAYYAALVERAGSVPVLAYHYPGVSAPGLPVEVIAGLPVAGVKDSSGSAERILETLETFPGAIYTGSAALLSYAGPLGCQGAILALANADPEACIAAWAGDAKAQLGLAGASRRASSDFPLGIKHLTAERFGTATHHRLG